MGMIAYDLGASSGRAIVGRLNANKLEIEVLHRFPNDPVQVGGRLQWDILRIYHEMKQGLLKAKHAGITLESLGIDSWAVDFGLIGTDGELLGNPYHYRDAHTDGMMELLFQRIPRSTIFARTGIQFMQFNTIYQLAALNKVDSPLLREASRLLMIPDLLRYFLTGEMANEFTNATTTQLFNPIQRAWDHELLAGIDIPSTWFEDPLSPGTRAGSLRGAVRDELGLGAIPVIAVAEHDTGSAVAAIPALQRPFAYLICGTWSLMGTEVDQPVMNERALQLNFTNEGGVGGTYRLLKNIMGLWILQESKREWDRLGESYTFPELIELAEQAPPFRTFIDPDHDTFLAPGDMPLRIREYCRATGQPIPSGIGEMVRCILESLALKYRYVLRLTEQLSGVTYTGLHMVGGGIQNEMLCRFTANAIGKPVWAGPVEGSAIGNLALQCISQGLFNDIWEARRIIRDSFPITGYEPSEAQAWEQAYGDFMRVCRLQ
jgi:rhamnulokinase